MVLPGKALEPELQSRQWPAPGEQEALIRVLACGLCGSDLFLQDGGFGDTFPVIPGHEAAGEIVALGDDTDGFAVHDVVGLYYIDNDPSSSWSQSGRPHLGPSVVRMGVDSPGALASFVIRPVRTLVKPRRPIPPAELALLTDVMATPYHALTSVAGVRPGENVLVIGVGGIGSNAVQLSALLGCRTFAIVRRQSSLDLAMELGAAAAADLAGARAMIDRGCPGGVDVVLMCADAPGLDRLALDLVTFQARIVTVAASTAPLEIRPVDLLWREAALLGSRGFTPQDITAVQELYLDGRLSLRHLMRDIRPMRDYASAFRDLRAHSGGTRILLIPDHG